MRSRLCVALAAFAIGVCLLQTSAALMPAAAWLTPVAGFLLLLAWRIRGHAGALSAALASVVLGAAYASWRAEARLADALDPQWEGRALTLTGVIDGLPAANERGTRFAFAVESVAAAGVGVGAGSASPASMQVPSRVSLAWFPDPDRDDDASAVPPLRAGERWTLRVRLKRPHGTVNPGGFDLEAWLLQHGLRATGHVVRDAANARRDAFAGRPRDVVSRAREAVRDRFLRDLAGAPYAGVVVALAIGDQRAIDEAQWAVFNRTGVGHLVSISGMHVTVFASLAGTLAFALLRRSVRITSRLPARKVAAGVGIACAAAYTALAGSEVPAVRTFVMLAIAAAGLWLGRPGTAGVVWLWALAGVLVWDPWAPLTPGFWLSYAAVALLLYASAARLSVEPAAGWRGRAAGTLREGTLAQWVVTVGLTPLTLALFAQTSLVAPFANAIAIPVVTLGVVPLALLAIVLPLTWLPVAAHAVLLPLMSYLEWLAAWPDATWQQHAPPAWTVATGVVGVLWILAPRGVPGRGWGIAWLLPLALVRPLPPAEGAFRLTVLDVGQGLAAVVETHRHVLVYDTGPGFNDVADAGGRIVAPYLRAMGLPRADAIVISHQDLDHAGGALSLMRAISFGSLLSSLPSDHPVFAFSARQHDSLQCIAGQEWTWDGVHFTILHPTRAEYDDPRTKTNDRSCVLRIDGAGGSALLTGDVEAISEARLLRKAPGWLRADLLVVPHHGSRTSSSLPFVRAVAPSLAIVASGYRNRFGHPKPDVLARYTGRGVEVARTDRAGAVTVTFAPEAPWGATGERERAARYWRNAAGE